MRVLDLRKAESLVRRIALSVHTFSLDMDSISLDDIFWVPSDSLSVNIVSCRTSNVMAAFT
jgi:hypothetical protein